MENLHEIKQAVENLYQVTRQAGVNANIHQNCITDAQKVMAYLEKQPDNSNSDTPEIIMPDNADNNNRVEKPETAKAGRR
tara:strand:- start:375 stop:614 length:240 start_codon:yes stop_codon:yes gene_type:complete